MQIAITLHAVHVELTNFLDLETNILESVIQGELTKHLIVKITPVLFQELHDLGFFL